MVCWKSTCAFEPSLKKRAWPLCFDGSRIRALQLPRTCRCNREACHEPLVLGFPGQSDFRNAKHFFWLLLWKCPDSKSRFPPKSREAVTMGFQGPRWVCSLVRDWSSFNRWAQMIEIRASNANVRLEYSFSANMLYSFDLSTICRTTLTLRAYEHAQQLSQTRGRQDSGINKRTRSTD